MAAAKQKTITRSKLTKVRTNIEALLNNESAYVSLDDFIEELKGSLSNDDARLVEFEAVENEYLLTLPDEEIDRAVNESGDLFQLHSSVRKRIIKRLELFQKESQPPIVPGETAQTDAASSASTTRESKLEVKLPKLELPKFGGEVIEFPSFWDRFQVSVHSTNIPEVQKFVYLDSLLYGEAKNTINGISITADNYKVACDLLTKRYGRKELIIFKHVQQLLSINCQGKVSYQNLRKHHDDLVNHVRCLESYNITGDQYGMFLTPIVLATLPFDIRMDWSKESEGKETDFGFLLKFLEREVRVRETSIALKPFTQETAKPTEKSKSSNFKSNQRTTVNKSSTPKTSAINLNSKTNQKGVKPKCNICDKNNHPTVCCLELLTPILVNERRKIITDKGLCIRCLSNEHSTSQCEIACEKCSGAHHKHLCLGNLYKNTKPPETKEKSNPDEKNKISQEKTHSHTGYSSRISKPGVILETIKVKVKSKAGKNEFINATVMFDNGADNSYITCELMKKVEGEYIGVTDLSVSAFGASEPSPSELRNVYLVDILGLDSGCGTLALTEVPVITTTILRGKLPEEIISQVKILNIQGDLESDEYLNIDILIGNNYYWEYIMPIIRPISQSQTKRKLVAIKTTFGWLLSGAYKIEEMSKSHSSTSLLCVDKSQRQSLFDMSANDADLQKVWDMEVVKEEKFEDPVLKKFNEQIQLKEERYEIKLPWKEEQQKLMNNYQIAVRKLYSLMKQLNKNQNLKESYDKAMNEMKENEMIEEVPNEELETFNKVFYIPPRPVIKEDSLTTKVRITLNAAAT